MDQEDATLPTPTEDVFYVACFIGDVLKSITCYDHDGARANRAIKIWRDWGSGRTGMLIVDHGSHPAETIARLTALLLGLKSVDVRQAPPPIPSPAPHSST